MTPSADVTRTMPFEVHSLLKRQSAQTRYTLPAGSTSAETNGGARTSICTSSSSWAMRRAGAKVAPPSVERATEMRSVPASSIEPKTVNATRSVPSGRTTGIALFGVAGGGAPDGMPAGADHVAPPSVEWRTRISPELTSR